MAKTPLIKSNLLNKILDSSKNAAMIAESEVMNNKDNIPIAIPAFNMALSGELDRGLQPGLHMIAGPSKHFKSLMMLIEMKAYLDKYPDGIAVLYDSEFGASLEYLDSLDIDDKRVVHIPISNIEEFKFDVYKLLDTVERGDKLIICVDSVGNLASKKEVDDAEEQKSVQDMTRAKAAKSVGRLITPKLIMKDIPMVIVNHTYQTQEMYSKTVVSGGTGWMYSANDVWVIGRQQEKDTEGLTGYNFIINIEKSRSVKEKSKIPVKVLFDGGIDRYSGILDLALESGHIVKPKNGWYCLPNSEKNVREADTGPLLEALLTNQEFKDFVKNKYKLSSNKLIQTPKSAEEFIDEDSE